MSKILQIVLGICAVSITGFMGYNTFMKSTVVVTQQEVAEVKSTGSQNINITGQEAEKVTGVSTGAVVSQNKPIEKQKINTTIVKTQENIAVEPVKKQDSAQEQLAAKQLENMNLKKDAIQDAYASYERCINIVADQANSTQPIKGKYGEVDAAAMLRLSAYFKSSRQQCENSYNEAVQQISQLYQ